MSSLKKFLSLLDAAEKRRVALVTLMIACMAVLEVVGVASIFPFLNVLGNPESVQENEWLARLYRASGAESITSFLAMLAAASFLAIAVSAAARIFTQYRINRFVQNQRHVLGVRLLRSYLQQPYGFFLNRHSSDIGRTILSEADVAVSQFIKPLMDLFAQGAIILVLLTLVLLVNPVVASAAVLIIGAFYGLAFALVRRRISRLSQSRISANRRRFRVASDALDAIKLVKLHGQEEPFVRRFDQPSAEMAGSIALTNTLTQVPRFVIETLAIGGILLVFVALILLRGGSGPESVTDILPVLGLYAFAGYRILPSAQTVYSAIATMRMGGPAIEEVHADLARHQAKPEPALGKIMQFKDSIELKNVTFKYAGADAPVLGAVNLIIRAGERVGIRGETGAGKSTLLDLILALQTPTEGELLVDGALVRSGNRRAWQDKLAYVPQDIVLADDSVAANIAFGEDTGDVDLADIISAAKTAQIHDFIESELSQGYATNIGERGIRLSGGQRQRIGIARALFRNPKVLVLDEATSALDPDTESQVLGNLDSMLREVTLILVSHREEALGSCDRVLEMSGGQVHTVECPKPRRSSE